MNSILTIEGQVPTRALISSHEHRNEVLRFSATVTEVKTQEQLETAVNALRELNGILKEVEGARKTVKAPVIALGKAIDKAADDFTESVEKEKRRMEGLANHFQQLQLREKQEREAAALREKLKAEEAIRKANEAAEHARTEAERLRAELAAETANLRKQEAEEQLSIPTNTPKGMTTRARWDFEILNPASFFSHSQLMWKWDAQNETLKLDRAGLIKALNCDRPHPWHPETGEDIIHANIGIRIFKHIAVSVRS